MISTCHLPTLFFRTDMFVGGGWVLVILYKLPRQQILTSHVLLDQFFLGDPQRLPGLAFPPQSGGYTLGFQPPDAHVGASEDCSL